jgi:HEPN domain-containing protein
MKQKKIFFILLILFIIPIVQAKDITLTLDQKDYYFKIGENALINLKYSNSYNKQIDGILSYTITQQINQGNFQYSSTNTQSNSFSIGDGDGDIQLNFGTSDAPMNLAVNLKFTYTDKNEMEINLDGINIHFVNDDSQKNNQQDKTSSSSQKSQSQSKSNTQQQSLQQMIDQTFGGQPQEPQNTQQKLQNNQLSQDSSALKQQMQKQIQEQQQMKEEFQKQLAQNNEFQEKHHDLLSQGYNITSAQLSPVSNNTGDFKLNYQNQKGEQASLKGNMQNGEITNIQEDTPEKRQKIIDLLNQNKQFQKYDKQLQEQGYNQQKFDFSKKENRTNIQVDYLNANNETAVIKSEIINDTIKKVELIKDNSKSKKSYWWILLLVLVLSVVGYLVYNNIRRKTNVEGIDDKKIIKKPFDYKKEALIMIEGSKKSFSKKEYKDAYMLAGQALRLYLSYKNNLKKEITNDEVIAFFRKNKKSFKEVKECFDLCSLVEFAKYQANKKDFEKIIRYATNIIKR